jgi:hypothetical protein
MVRPGGSRIRQGYGGRAPERNPYEFLIRGRLGFEAMQDLVHVAIILGFVLLSVGFVRLCDRI